MLTHDDMLVGDHTLYVKYNGKWIRYVWANECWCWTHPQAVSDDVADYLEYYRELPHATTVPALDGTQVLYSKNGDVR